MTLQDTIPSLLSTKPKNNLFYTKAETIQLINRTKEGTLMRGELIDAILKRKLIPVSRATMYRVLKRHKDKPSRMENYLRVTFKMQDSLQIKTSMVLI